MMRSGNNFAQAIKVQISCRHMCKIVTRSVVGVLFLTQSILPRGNLLSDRFTKEISHGIHSMEIHFSYHLNSNRVIVKIFLRDTRVVLLQHHDVQNAAAM